MNTVSGNTSSLASMATSVLGNARQAFKAMADAATNTDAAGETAVPAGGGRSSRRGTILDRYL